MTKDDVSAAGAFGDLKYVNLKYVYGDELEQATNGEQYVPAAAWEPLCECADSFDRERDYVLICGDHLQLVTLCAIMGRRHPYFKVLRWDRQARGYIPVTIIT